MSKAKAAPAEAPAEAEGLTLVEATEAPAADSAAKTEEYELVAGLLQVNYI